MLGLAEVALAVLETSRCDLLISDVTMPGMDGLALVRLALARQPELPVILTSGYKRAEVDDGSHIAGVTFLAKPYGQSDLLAAAAKSRRWRVRLPDRLSRSDLDPESVG